MRPANSAPIPLILKSRSGCFSNTVRNSSPKLLSKRSARLGPTSETR